IENLERTGEIKKTILLEAPATGVVVKRNAIEGAFIKAGMDLFEIADLRSVWVHASFYDNEVPWISEGQQVEMELSYLPGRTYTGRVSYVYPYLREKARDVHVRLIFSNPNLDLKPGMYANVRLQGKTIPKALIVPSEAVVRSGTRDIVFVVRGEGRFEPREIRIGEEGGPDNSYVRVISGLLDGEDVVTSAQFMLDSESRLQEAIQKMLSDQMNRSSPAGSPQSKEDSVSLRPTESVADVDSADPEHSMKSAESVPDSLSAEHNQNIQSSAATPSVPPAEHEHPAPPAEHEHPAPPAEHEHPAPPAEHEHPAPPVEHEHDSHSADSTNAA
ncbi:MAG: efflux RND transporter periplasmic adaptor subunit, partial [Acidimicrobiia bacterium]|nr:efflux RND transporter periplasmic adaptor subunit [Acidimicrobiia bacterium]